MDNGFPLTTEPSILKEMIPPPTVLNRVVTTVTGTSRYGAAGGGGGGGGWASSWRAASLNARQRRDIARAIWLPSTSAKLPQGSMSAIPWRKLGIKYTSNEFYMDVVEAVDAIIGPYGARLARSWNWIEAFAESHVAGWFACAASP